MEGCCSYGAHLTDEADASRVAAAADTLSGEQWQFRAKGRRKTGVFKRDPSGAMTTRLVEGACIFLNRPGHPGGAGCALHRAALERGVPPLELKPDVCWQLPLRREDTVAPNGHVTSSLREWGRGDWGEGGAEFGWWCTEAPEAFSGRDAVYRSLRDEIVAMTGQEVYESLASYLESRSAQARNYASAASDGPQRQVSSGVRTANRAPAPGERRRQASCGAKPSSGAGRGDNQTRGLRASSVQPRSVAALRSASGVASGELATSPPVSSSSSSSSDS